MIMEHNHIDFSDYTIGYNIDEQTDFPYSDQFFNMENEFKFDVPSPAFNFMDVLSDPPDPDPGSFIKSSISSPGEDSLAASRSFSPLETSSGSSTGWSPEGVAISSSNDSDSSDPVLSFISQMLMDENMENKPFMFDPSALRDTERSLFDAIGEQYLLSPNSPLTSVSHESPDSLSKADTSHGFSTMTSTGTRDFVDIHGVGNVQDVIESKRKVQDVNPSPKKISLPEDYYFQFNTQFSADPSTTHTTRSGGLNNSSASEMVQNMFNDTESVLQFQRGLEEASKFLPKITRLVIDPESNVPTMEQKKESPKAVVKEEKLKTERSSKEGSRGRKNHEREDSEEEERRSYKQSAGNVEDGELSEMFDKVLLWNCGADPASFCFDKAKEDGARKQLSADDHQGNASNGGKTRARKEGKEETVDLRSLLILCAQSVSAYDFRTANELLKQIRQHSSRTGDGSQRLAHFFANGLEARMAGSSIDFQTFFTSLTTKRTTAADILKSYKTMLNACPYKRFSIFFANKMILHAAEKASTLHIVDFGVLYGYQWPMLIQKLSYRPGGPPKLRITGIELPQRGLRPAERIEETGRRLAKYCERFNVPFEYNPIPAQHWEKIPIEDLKITRDEVLAVNCLSRFKHLHDETDEVSCPRDAVLALIRKMKPDIFVLSVMNGSYNAPFFLTRFREALFHFSSIFDMLDCTVPRDDPERLMMETEFHGREAMNAVACEGLERIERPETCKQWQARIMKAGFKSLPLDEMLMKKLRSLLKAGYHKDFVIDQENDWMLQGWKGRINYASSCWVPS
ncbi:hypothetical protein K2173_015778 [Erythroxylum novogranatense]|uniref:Uncharacterized protein n=1 Tax=Erythroxylum novogranatense TaxID=1862640 RepID=A0AAV8SF13_9ROSI|nr:hypothetical protein K2173_015778 [Erythroxylum novogranatense]